MGVWVFFSDSLVRKKYHASKELFPVKLQSQNGFNHSNTRKLSDSQNYDIVNVLVSSSVTGGQKKRFKSFSASELVNFDQVKDCDVFLRHVLAP